MTHDQHHPAATTPDAPPTKTDLLARIDRSWSALETAIAGATEQHLTTPAAPGAWSVKDHLAHLAAWQLSLLALLEGRPRHAAMGIDHLTYESGEDAVNALLHEHHKDRPLPETLDLLRRTHAQVLAALAPLSDLDLLRPYSHFQPDDGPFNPDPVVGWIAGNTHEHIDEHLPAIRRLLDTAPPSPPAP